MHKGIFETMNTYYIGVRFVYFVKFLALTIKCLFSFSENMHLLLFTVWKYRD